jgi:hypothetical protein
LRAPVSETAGFVECIEVASFGFAGVSADLAQERWSSEMPVRYRFNNRHLSDDLGGRGNWPPPSNSPLMFPVPRPSLSARIGLIRHASSNPAYRWRMMISDMLVGKL